MDSKIQELMEYLIGKEGNVLIEKYNLPFKKESNFIRDYLWPIACPQKLAVIAVKIIEETYEFCFLSSKNDKEFKKLDTDKQRAHHEIWGIFHEFYEYYLENKKNMFEKLKSEDLSQIRLIEIYGLIFFYLIARYILAQQDFNDEKAFWIKEATMSSSQIYNLKIKWSDEELITNWHEKGEFPAPETAESAYQELYQCLVVQLSFANYSSTLKANKKFLHEYGGSYKYAVEYYESNKKNELYFFQSSRKFNQTKMAKNIFDNLIIMEFLNDKKEISLENGVKTINGWLKDHKKGVSKLNCRPAISSKKIREIIKNPTRE